MERMELIRDLRLGEFDVLVGINLLREGLDLPEVALVAILDADKEGFLRSETSLIQTIGRAARNVDGRVIMYADAMTDSHDASAIDETNRRRAIQHGVQRGARHHPQDRAHRHPRADGSHAHRRTRPARPRHATRKNAAWPSTGWRSRCSLPPTTSTLRRPPSCATRCWLCGAKNRMASGEKSRSTRRRRKH